VAGSRIPISSSNIATLIGFQTSHGVAATNAYQIAYDANTLVPNQTLEANNELRGNRQSGSKIPGAKAPGGTLTFHQTDLTLPFSWYATLGTLSAGAIVPQQAPTATLRAVAGLVTSGTHSYKYVITDDTAGTRGSDSSNSVTTVEANHGQVTVGRPGALPVGWTWALYRTAAGNALTGPWVGVPGATALAASVTSFVDNVADGSLSGTWPVSFTADDHLHTITIGNTLPEYTIERSYPYVGDAAAYFYYLDCVVNRATCAVKSSGYYDMSLDFLCGSQVGPNVSSFDASPVDWRGGEKLHHQMIAAAKVKLDGSSFQNFEDLTITHANNLDTTDYPLGLNGNAESRVPGLAQTTISGALKVTQPDSLSLVADTSVLHDLEIQWDFATGGHYSKIHIYGVQFDPAMAAPSGQGILKFTCNGSASQPDGGQQIIATVFNSVSTATYQS
jgi:hypothetical protein